MNATVKENIVIAGGGNETVNYNDIIKNTSLQTDINEWKEKDFTLLGEKGVLLALSFYCLLAYYLLAYYLLA